MTIVYLITIFLIDFIKTDELNETSSLCVYTQNYWINHINKLSSDELCGSKYDELMKINTFQMNDKNQYYWILTFHTLYTSISNRKIIYNHIYSSDDREIIDTIDFNDTMTEINTSILFLYDSMERMCDNITNWSINAGKDILISNMLEILSLFNSGLLYPIPACTDEFSNKTIFSFSNNTDLFIFHDESVTTTINTNSLHYIYKIQLFLFISTCILTGSVAILIVYIIMIKNTNRKYLLRKSDLIQNNNDNDYNHLNHKENDEEEEEEDTSGESIPIGRDLDGIGKETTVIEIDLDKM